MTTRQAFIAELLESNKILLGRYLKGFSDANHTAQAPGLPNHVAWCLGHLALTMHRAAEKLDPAPIPAADFIDTKGRSEHRGDARRFSTESVAFGSTPAGDAARYPSFARCQEIYNNAIDRLAAAVRGATDAQLDAVTAWGPSETPIGLLCARMAFHNGMHTGQIADLRRALGIGSVFA